MALTVPRANPSSAVKVLDSSGSWRFAEIRVAPFSEPIHSPPLKSPQSETTGSWNNGEARNAFPPAFLLPDWDPEILKEHNDWLLPRHYHARTDRFITSLHSWVIRTKHHTILVDTCAGNHKERPHSPLFHMKDTPYLDRL